MYVCRGRLLLVVRSVSECDKRTGALFTMLLAGVAQQVEQLICNQQVAGSSPIASSIASYNNMDWRGTRVAKGSRL